MHNVPKKLPLMIRPLLSPNDGHFTELTLKTLKVFFQKTLTKDFVNAVLTVWEFTLRPISNTLRSSRAVKIIISLIVQG